jgi:hypothetical protein
MVSSAGAAQVSNAYPLSRVALALVGYATVVAGSADAGLIVRVVIPAASTAAATPIRQRFIVLSPLAEESEAFDPTARNHPTGCTEAVVSSLAAVQIQPVFTQ